MNVPVWHCGGAPFPPVGEDAPLAWHCRMDDAAIQALANQAALRDGDLEDLAGRPQSTMRALRRRLTRVLLSNAAGMHPDDITIRREPLGQLTITTPKGWHVSVAGQWPHCLIGVSRRPIGVDIEPVEAPAPPDDVFTPAELADMARHANALTPVCRWAAKEAHAKLLGVASCIDPTEITTLFGQGSLRALSSGGQTECAFFVTDGMVLAVASFAV